MVRTTLPQLIRAIQDELHAEGYVEDVDLDRLPLDELLLYGVLPLFNR